MAVAPEALAARGLFERNERRVYSYCLHQLGAREEAEDAVQTTFLHALRGLRRGAVPRVESAWLLKIARNVCLRRWETRGRERRFEVVCDPHVLEDGVGGREDGNGEAAALADAVARLPERQREAILLREWQGLTYVEIANRLELTVSAVEALLFRARRSLAEALSEEPAKKRRHGLFEPGSLVAALKSFLGGSVLKLTAAAAVVSTATLAGGVALEHRSHQVTPSGSGPRSVVSREATKGAASAPAARSSRAVRPDSPIASRAIPSGPVGKSDAGGPQKPAAPSVTKAPIDGTQQPAPVGSGAVIQSPTLPVGGAVPSAPSVPAVVVPTLPAITSLPATPSLPVTPSLLATPALPATPSLPSASLSIPSLPRP